MAVPARALGPDPELRDVGRPARVPARHDRDTRRERPLPARTEGEPVTTLRRASKERATKETTIKAALEVDGRGITQVTTGLPFFDHMLEQLGKHGSFD